MPFPVWGAASCEPPEQQEGNLLAAAPLPQSRHAPHSGAKLWLTRNTAIKLFTLGLFGGRQRLGELPVATVIPLSPRTRTLLCLITAF